MAVNAGGRVVGRRGGGLLGRTPASALSTATTPATPQHISHYLAHQPRATWEALSAAFPAGAVSHGHVDAVLLSLARHPHASLEPVAKNALTFFLWSAAAAAASSSSPPLSSSHSLRSYCLLVHLLSRAALFRDASVLLESAISKHLSSSPTASCFLDAFFDAYEDSDTTVTTRGLHLLVHAYARLRLPTEALEACRYLARRGVLPSLSALNAALRAAQRAGSFGVAWEVFELMTLKRLYANQSTVELVIGILSREGRLARTAALVESIHGKKCAPGIVAHVALTLRMIEEERVEQVVLLLKRLLQRNILLDDIAYSLIVHAYCHIGNLKSALEQCDDMVRRGCSLNAFVYTCLIRAHCCAGSMDKAAQLHQEMLSMGAKPYDATYNHLIAGCFRQGMVKEGLGYFDNMQEEGFVLDIASCNEMLEGLCNAGEVRRANNLLTAMMDRGLLPDQDTYLSLINGYGKAGDIQGIVNIYHEIEHRGLDPGVEVFTALIKGLCRCGNLKEAEKFFAFMKKKTVAPTSDLYDMLIRGYCEKHNAKRALWLYDKMVTENDNLAPSAETFMMLVRRVINVKNVCFPDS